MDDLIEGGGKTPNDGLRYRSGGELHRDFHASILDGVNYVRGNYGEEALREVLFNTGTKVYDIIGRETPQCEFWVFQDKSLAAAKYGEIAALRGADLVKTNF